jgi:hypothetical protein
MDIDAIPKGGPGYFFLIPRELEDVVQFDALVQRDGIWFRSGNHGWAQGHGEFSDKFRMRRL